MARKERSYHPKFLQYQKFIVNHENYKTLPNKFNSNGEITWVRVNDLERAKWWDELKKELKLPDRASVARRIHPPELNQLKPCQVCGTELNINYKYLNARIFESLRNEVPELGTNRFRFQYEDLIKFILATNKSGIDLLLREKLKIDSIAFNNQNTELLQINPSLLSPGVMSNAPDRLDGFHTYNACCRSSEDTGRHKSNLARYSQDRRAYENWASGDWRGANRLMGVFAESSEKIRCPECNAIGKMTADHIGPISLGFSHRMKFRPLCRKCNSKKNNRMTYRDIRELIADEAQGEIVISWHSKYVWDSLKFSVKNDDDALRLSQTMRQNLHSVLTVIAFIYANSGETFLSQFLNPEYGNYDFKFEYFNPATGEFKASRFPIDSVNSRKNIERYLRVSFESLSDYSNKLNRKRINFQIPDVDKKLKKLIEKIEQEKNPDLKTEFISIIQLINAFSIRNF